MKFDFAALDRLLEFVFAVAVFLPILGSALGGIAAFVFIAWLKYKFNGRDREPKPKPKPKPDEPGASP